MLNSLFFINFLYEVKCKGFSFQMIFFLFEFFFQVKTFSTGFQLDFFFSPVTFYQYFYWKIKWKILKWIEYYLYHFNYTFIYALAFIWSNLYNIENIVLKIHLLYIKWDCNFGQYRFLLKKLRVCDVLDFIIIILSFSGMFL